MEGRDTISKAGILTARPAETAPRTGLTGKHSPLPASLDEPRLLDPDQAVVQLVKPPLEPQLESMDLPEIEPVAEPSPVESLAQLEALFKTSVQPATEESEKDNATDHTKAGSALPATPSSDEQLAQAYYGEAVPESELVFERARSCIEDLAMFGVMRRATLGEPWLSSKRVERRLLRRVDALVACGPEIYPRLVAMLEDRPMPDPDLTWAHLFYCGSIAGEDSLAQLMRIALSADLEEAEIRLSVADALALAPHPGIERFIRGWLGDSSWAKRWIAVHALSRREALTAQDASRAAADVDVRVVAAAAEAFGSLPEPVGQTVLQSLLHHTDEDVVRSAIRSALLQRMELGLRRAVELVEKGNGNFADAALFVAIGGRSEHFDLLMRAATQAPSSVFFRALGWLGHVGAMNRLLETLSDGDDDSKSAAHEALERITGAALAEADPEPKYREGDQPFLRTFNPPKPCADLTADGRIWTAWWGAHQQHARENTRYRYGCPWSLAQTLWDLEDERASLPSRRLAQVELVVRSGGAAALNLEGFVARQLKQISACKASLAARARELRPGTWSTRYRGQS